MFKKTVLYNLPQFKGFGIFLSGIETTGKTRKRESGMKGELLNTPIQSPHFRSLKWNVTPYSGNLFSQWYG